MWNKFKATKWFIPVLIAVIVGILAGTVVLAASLWTSKTVPATGTIQITTTTPAPDFDFSLTSPIAFGNTTFAAGDPITITGTVTVANTGNQPINSLGIACSNLPPWLTTINITQTAVPAGGSQLETVTITGTAPAGPTTFNFVGPTALTTCNVTITPGS